MDGAQDLASQGRDVEIEILGLTADSRAVKPGYLFAALPGTRLDGRRFVGDAIARGASAILIESVAGLSAPVEGSPSLRVIVDANPRRRLAQMAARFFAPQPRVMVAVTGTNGKTSVTAFTRQIWARAGWRAASLGTIGIVGPDFSEPGTLTTPDPVMLHQKLGALARNGIDHAAIEASSHGLDQFRLDGLSLSAAAFTNLTRDHLDYHRDMAAYFAAKARLFTELLPQSATAVVNIDTAEGERLAVSARARGLRVLGFGTAPGAALRLVSARPAGDGQAVAIEALGARRSVTLALLGSFQASNALAALGLAIATDTPLDTALDALAHLAGAPGRMERVATHPSGAPVIVDYAHTPDALETALVALRPHCRDRLALVFGCGGDRDPGKRPQMGAIAERLADRIIVTDDNPRSEDPAAIRRAILGACPKAGEIGDRATAIRTALAELASGDLLLIAGKGHESGQIIGDKTLPFSDADVARALLAAMPRMML